MAPNDSLHLDAVNYDGDIIADEDGADESWRRFNILGTNHGPFDTLIALQLNSEFIGWKEGNFQSRKEGRQK